MEQTSYEMTILYKKIQKESGSSPNIDGSIVEGIRRRLYESNHDKAEARIATKVEAWGFSPTNKCITMKGLQAR